ncbi:MAG: hypothetical protein WA234_08825, partial [Rectinemataceae bacterium]
RVAAVYLAIRETVGTTYGETEIARIFGRVFDEYFTVVDGRITIRPSEDLHSGILQSPDDVEATMREFSRRTEAGKLKARGLFKAELFAVMTAIVSMGLETLRVANKSENVPIFLEGTHILMFYRITRAIKKMFIVIFSLTFLS